MPWPARRTPRWRPALIGAAIAAAAGAVLWLAWPQRGGEEAPRPVVAPATLAGPVAAPATMAAAPVTLPPPANRPVPVPDTTFAPSAPVKPRASAQPEASLQLQAIGERDGRPVAVISSRVVREGDHYDGVTIVRIGADEVEIEVEGRRRTLRF